MGQPRYQVYKDKNLLDKFRLISSDEEVLLISGAFTGRHLAEIGVFSCQKYAANPMNYVKRDCSNDTYYFVLKKPDNEIIGSSMIFNSPIERDEKLKRCLEDSSTEKIERLMEIKN